MSFVDEFVQAAVTRQYGAKDAVALRSMPTRTFVDSHIIGPKKRRIARQAIDFVEYTPNDIQGAMDAANGSGVLQGRYGVGSIAAWLDSNPVYHGVTEARVNIPWRRVGIKHSDEAAAWLEGTPTARGWRKRIADPAELAMCHRNRHTAGYCGGLVLWNEEKGHPEFQALDTAQFRYVLSDDRWEYHGWSKVFRVTPGDGVWVLDGLTKNDPWRHGSWYRLGKDNHNALNATMLEAIWMQAFAMPTVLAYHPQGASEDQKQRFTTKLIGAALKVVGVTGGYKLEFAQAKAEGKDTFDQVTQRLRENVSIDTWGTLGLIAGGSGFANSDLFDAMKDETIAIEAERQARMENEQLWQPVLDWGVRRGDLSPAARNAILEYLTESPAVIERKAKAAKALIDQGYTPEEAQRRVGLEKQAMPETAPTSGVRPITPPVAPETREEEEPEPSYSEKLASDMTTHNRTECPHGETRACRSCRVALRYETTGDGYKPVWQSFARRAA
jgi:hypothetical protein